MLIRCLVLLMSLTFGANLRNAYCLNDAFNKIAKPIKRNKDNKDNQLIKLLRNNISCGHINSEHFTRDNLKMSMFDSQAYPLICCCAGNLTSILMLLKRFNARVECFFSIIYGFSMISTFRSTFSHCKHAFFCIKTLNYFVYHFYHPFLCLFAKKTGKIFQMISKTRSLHIELYV